MRLEQLLFVFVFYRAISSVGLERALDKGEVDGSSPSWPCRVFLFWGYSSIGGALLLHSRG